MSTIDVLPELVRAIRPKRVLEIGSWKGRSAIQIASSAQELGLDTEVLCVDTWLGSVEHWTNEFASGYWSRENLSVVDGEPELMAQFRENVTHSGFEEVIRWIRGPSEGVMRLLREKGESFDLIFLDGDHAFWAVLRDIRLSFDLIEPGQASIIVGDDWVWTSVRMAALVARRPRGFRLWVRENTFVFWNGASFGLRRDLQALGLRPVRFLGVRLLSTFFRQGVKRLVRRRQTRLGPS